MTTHVDQDHEYVFAPTEDDSESQRLSLLESIRDPQTIRLLRATGLAAGWQCLEVGAGRGSITRWLAGEVGTTGRVVAADIDPRFLGELPGNVDVRRMDVRTDEFEPGCYDLVHCRYLLMHLPNAQVVLAKMFAALKPGGWLVLEEGDAGLMWLAGPGDGEFANDVLQRQIVALQRAGIVDFSFGRKLPGLVAGLGVESLGGQITGTVGHHGDDAVDWMHRSVLAVHPAFRAMGFSDDELARQSAVFTDPASVLTPLAMVGVWARKPSGSKN